MHHAYRFTEANLHKLEQDLERFAEQRLLISRNLQRWFVIHEHNSTWETKDPCKKCSALFDKIEEIYFVACSNVRDMMTVLEKSLRASALFYKNNLEHTPSRAKDQTLGEFCAPLLQHLESTKRMLQSLYDDAEKRKGWPQVSSRAQHSSVASQPADDQDQEKQAESDATKVGANASSSTITSSQINEVFGNTVFPLAHFGRILGCKDGQVSFAINCHSDISAQQWSQSDSQWFCIGYFSRSHGRIMGTLATHRLREELRLHVPALPQNCLGYFKAIAKQHEAYMMKHKFGPEELKACLTKASVDRAAQEVVGTPSATEARTQSEPEPGDAEMTNADQGAKIDGAKAKEMESKKSKSKKQKKRKGRR